MKFNSQICTTREQSERLIALGLKKETADMHWYKPAAYECDYWFVGVGMEWGSRDIPAWSLHRLMCLVFNSGGTHVELFEDDDAYEILVYKIEIRIKEGYFPKEYLVDLTGTDSHQDMVDAFRYAFEAMKAKKEE